MTVLLTPFAQMKMITLVNMLVTVTKDTGSVRLLIIYESVCESVNVYHK